MPSVNWRKSLSRTKEAYETERSRQRAQVKPLTVHVAKAFSQVCVSGGPAGADPALPGETAAQQEQRRRRFREFKEEKPVSHQAFRSQMFIR